VLGSLLLDARGHLGQLVHPQCLSAGLLAERIGLGEPLRDALACIFERWDGGGLPTGAQGTSIPVETRVEQVARSRCWRGLGPWQTEGGRLNCSTGTGTAELTR